MADSDGSFTGQDEQLLLEFGIDSDKNSFDEARDLLKELSEGLEDITSDISLGDLLSSLRQAAEILKGAVDLWNSLEDKALTVGYTALNYLPYNLDTATRQNITNRVESSKLADKFDISPSTILNDLDRIITEQSKIMVQGKNYSPEPLIAVTRLAEKVGRTEFALGTEDSFDGSNLAKLITETPALEFYSDLTGMLADAYRLAYSYPSKSTEREELLQFIKQAEQTPFVSKEVGQYISEMTEPNVPGYSKKDNPAELFWARTAEDDEEGEYIKQLKARSGKALSLSTDMDIKKSEAKETTNQLTLRAYNFLAEQLVLPFLDSYTMMGQFLSGKKQTYNPFENFEFTDKQSWKNLINWMKGRKERLELFNAVPGSFNSTLAESVKILSYIDKAEDPTYIPGRFALSENWVEGRKDSVERKQKLLKSVPSEDINQEVGQELALYEVMRMGRLTYQQDAKLSMAYYMQAVADDPYFKEDFRKGRNSSEKRINGYTAIANAIADPSSPYYLPPDTGFLPIYNRLYETNNLTPDEYLKTIAEAFVNTDIAQMNKLYGAGTTTGTDIVSATVGQSYTKEGKPELNLILTIKEEDKEGNIHTRNETISFNEVYNTVKSIEHVINTEY